MEKFDFLPFSKPSLGDKEIKAVREVLNSGWITTGNQVSQFESAFSNFIGSGGPGRRITKHSMPLVLITAEAFEANDAQNNRTIYFC